MDKICIEPSINTSFIFNISLHIIILFTILSVFFMVYISKIASESLNSELKDNIENGFNTLIKNMTTKQKTILRSVVGKVPLDSLLEMYKDKDSYVEMYNNMLFKIIIIINIALFGIIITGITLLTKNCNQCIPVGKIIKQNLLTFGVVGVVEYLFFTKVALKFIPVKPSTIITESVNSVKNSI